MAADRAHTVLIIVLFFLPEGLFERFSPFFIAVWADPFLVHVRQTYVQTVGGIILHTGILVERNNARIWVGALCLGGRGFLHKRLSQHGRRA